MDFDAKNFRFMVFAQKQNFVQAIKGENKHAYC